MDVLSVSVYMSFDHCFHHHLSLKEFRFYPWYMCHKFHHTKKMVYFLPRQMYSREFQAVLVKYPSLNSSTSFSLYQRLRKNISNNTTHNFLCGTQSCSGLKVWASLWTLRIVSWKTVEQGTRISHWSISNKKSLVSNTKVGPSMNLNCSKFSNYSL